MSGLSGGGWVAPALDLGAATYGRAENGLVTIAVPANRRMRVLRAFASVHGVGNRVWLRAGNDYVLDMTAGDSAGFASVLENIILPLGEDLWVNSSAAGSHVSFWYRLL